MLPLLFFLFIFFLLPQKVWWTQTFLARTHIPKPTMDENLQEDALLSLSECAPLNLPSP